MRTVAKKSLMRFAKASAALYCFCPGSLRIRVFFLEKNLNCSREPLSICGDLMILIAAERLAMLPVRTVFSFKRQGSCWNCIYFHFY